MTTSRAAQIQLLTNWSGVLFIVGKVLSFILFFLFLFTVMSSAKFLAGYSRHQVVLFFLVFSLIDIMIQLLYRGVYRFRWYVISGRFDLDLVRPLPSFFRPLFGWADILDLITLVPLWFFFFWYLVSHQLLPSIFQSLSFLVLLLNSLIIGFALHLSVAAVGIITMEVDHLVWIYRDLTNMARFPTDIYSRGIRLAITFTVPVVVMMTVPAKALLGLLNWPWLVGSVLIGCLLLLVSLKFWSFALKRYASASS